MVQLRDGIDADMSEAGNGEHEDGADSGGECMSQNEINKKLDELKSCPLEAGELQIVTLGKLSVYERLPDTSLCFRFY